MSKEIDGWCSKQCDKLTKRMQPHIMSGGSLDDPEYRRLLGQHQAFMRVRSFIHGSWHAQSDRSPQGGDGLPGSIAERRKRGAKHSPKHPRTPEGYNMTAQARWPAMMRKATAAEYVDMSEAAFVREIMAGRLPAGVIFGGREHWSREAIDRALANLTGTGAEPDYRREMKERYGKAA